MFGNGVPGAAGGHVQDSLVWWDRFSETRFCSQVLSLLLLSLLPLSLPLSSLSLSLSLSQQVWDKEKVSWGHMF